MKITKLIPLLLLALGCYLAGTTVARAQINSQEELTAFVLRQDSMLFDLGFHHCDLSQFEAYISEDFEFYHDKNGLTNTKAAFIESIRKGICGSGEAALQRRLLPESTQIFPLFDQGQLYGAVQIGQHHFGDKPARFSHLWIIEEDGRWRLRRVLSYDH